MLVLVDFVLMLIEVYEVDGYLVVGRDVGDVVGVGNVGVHIMIELD